MMVQSMKEDGPQTNLMGMELIIIIMGIFTLAIGKMVKKHGKGVFSWKSGDVYEGYWVEGKRSGIGLMIMQNGEKWAVRVLDFSD